MNRDYSIDKPELMSPAGHWPQLEAAISAGADAVYFGLQHFSARAKVGFSLKDLSDVIKQLHRNAVKGFITFNTLVFDHELKQACETIEAIASSGADAIIVQDIGIAKLAKQIAPELDIHGSTQMSITSAEGAEFAASLGCSRVVLGRELSIKDIRKIAAATRVELEAFVHGALCVSYSGQCFSSEAWGGRSANRGKCAQACRLSYDLIVDGVQRELGEFRYLLSPGDLYALDQIPELIESGISCFKIEGRYKGADYVALTTKAYRDAIDQYYGETPESKISRTDLEQVYSRGLGSHFVSGTNHQNVVIGRAPRHRGVQVGVVKRIEHAAVVVVYDHCIKAGDGLVFDSANWRSPDEAEEGGNVYEVENIDADSVRLRFGHNEIDFGRVRAGDLVWRTNQPALQKTVKSVLSQPKTSGVRFVVEANPGAPLVVAAESSDGIQATFKSEQLLDPAHNKSLSIKMLSEQFARLGDTPFHLEDVQLKCKDDTFCPVSLLNRARRELIAQIIDQREHKNTGRSITIRSITQPRLTGSENDDDRPKIHVLVRNSDQLAAAIDCCPDSITLDYLELYGLRPSVKKIVEAGILPRVASPRILKPTEQKVIRFLLSLNCSLLIRSSGLLHDLVSNTEFNAKLPDLHGDFSLNAANVISLETYLDQGMSRVTPTYDLNANQIIEFGETALKPNLEVVAYHHLPVFHTEHCVFCRFLSDGTDNTNCGHPCEKHRISVQDLHGRRHAVLADVGCRNTVFGAEAQFAPSSMNKWIQAGIQHFRIEFVHQNAKQVESITKTFLMFLQKSITFERFRNDVASHSDQGVTEGSLFVPKDYKNLIQIS